MDANIILSGRGPNAFNAFRAGADAGQQQIGYNQQNALAQTLQAEGPGILAGNPNSLNALARFDPAAALGVQQTQQTMQFSAEEMAMKRTAAAQQTAAALAAQQDKIDSKALAAEAAQLERLLSGAAAAYARGDKAGYDAWIMQNGGDPAQMPFEQFPSFAATSTGALDAIKTFTPPPPKEVLPMSNEGEIAWDQRRGFLTDNQAAAALAPKTGVTVNTGENGSAFDKKGAEIAAQRMSDIVTTGQGAQGMMGDLGALAEIAKGLETGLPAQIMGALGPYADALGIPVDGLGPAQAYDAIVARMAPQMRTPGAGASSDFDAKQFMKSLPSLGKTPEGNAIISATLQAMQEMKIASAEIAASALAGDITWREADKQIAALGNPFDAFNKFKGKGEAAGSGGLSQDDLDFLNGAAP